jgi:hypothetical protein
MEDYRIEIDKEKLKKKNKCKIIFEILFFSFIAGTFITSSITAYSSYNSNYISRQFRKIWSTNYILDITATEQSECPTGYTLKKLGKWSGFNGGCYCINGQTKTQIATDETCSDDLKDIFTCHSLMNVPPVDLYKFKNFSFCIKYSQHNYFSLFEKVRNKFFIDNGHMNHENMEYSEHLKLITETSPLDFLSDYSIIDIKMLDPNLFNPAKVSQFYYNLTNYEEKKISNDLSIFILRLKNIGRKINVLDINKIIVDLRYFNELWCSYLDISSTYEYHKFSKDEVNYAGIDYCERFYKDKNSYLSYNDNFVNTINTSFDFDYTKKIGDVYGANGITRFYELLSTADNSHKPVVLKNTKQDDIQPVLVAQKYFSGIGCLYSKSPLDHIEELKVLSKVSKINAFIVIIISFVIISCFFMLCAIFNKKNRLRYILVKYNFVLCLVAFIVSLISDKIIQDSIHYFKNYMLYCQTDFTNDYDNNAQKTSPQEIRYYEELSFAYLMSGLNSFGLFLTNCSLIIYIFIIFKSIVVKSKQNNISQDNKNLPQEIQIRKNNEYKNVNGVSVSNINDNEQPREIEINIINLDNQDRDKNSISKPQESGFPEVGVDEFEFENKSRASVHPRENFDNSDRKFIQDSNRSDNDVSNNQL